MEQVRKLNPLDTVPEHSSIRPPDNSTVRTLNGSSTNKAERTVPQYTAANTRQRHGDASGGEAGEDHERRTVDLLKSVWYLVILVLLNLVAAIVFMGIEGTAGLKVI